MSFLPTPAPPAPAETQESATEQVPAEPPVVLMTASVRRIPTSSAPMVFPPRPTMVDPYLRRAEEHFQLGRRLHQEGNATGARKEFDRAIDVLLDAPDDVEGALALEKKYDKLVEAIYRIDVDGLGSGEPEQEPVYVKAPIDELTELTFPIDPRLKSKVKEEVRGTVSQLPLQENDAVLSYVNFFSSDRGRRILLAGLKRAGRYKPMITRILREEGVPDELIYLAQAESAFLPRAISRKQATGMWQFMRSRGIEYGLKQTPYSDDRLDPEMATRAAAQHLRDLYKEFGDWYLALAAYNCGPGGVSRAVTRTGYADYWELRGRSALPKETANYVPIIVAMTIVVKNAADYGITDIETDPPLEYETLETEALTSLPLIADAADRPLSEIRELNPSLLRNLAPAGHSVHVPNGTLQSVTAALKLVPASQRAAWRLHRIEDGDTFASIARRYGVPASTVESANASASLTEGSLVVVPAAYKETKAPVQAVKSRPSRSKAQRSATASKGQSKLSTRIHAKPAGQKVAVNRGR